MKTKDKKTEEKSHKEGLTYHKTMGGSSTIQTNFNKNGNKFSMIETSNKVDEEKATKENNISLSRNPTPLFSSVTVKNFDKREISLIIEAEEIPQKIPLEILNMMLCFY